MVKFRIFLLTLTILLAVLHDVSSKSIPFPKTSELGTIGPWGYEYIWTNWDTSLFLVFKYERTAFRIMPPNGVTYDSDTDVWDFGSGEKYLILIFFHGRRQVGADNNVQNATLEGTKGLIDKVMGGGASTLVVYSNPFEKELSVKIESSTSDELFNQLRQQMYYEEFTLNVGNQIITMDTERLTSGMYLLRVISSSSSPQVFKMII